MIEPLADQIWHLRHPFSVNGLPITSRMTIVRFPDGGLWLHSPVPMNESQYAALDRLGPVRCIVAPSKTHHLFVADCLRAYPEASLFGAPGLREKRPDLLSLQDMPADAQAPWAGELESILFEGIPFANETIWWHPRSRTLIVTDLLQWWAGELAFPARLYACLTGVRARLGVPRTVRLLLRDRAAARRSAARLLAWPAERLLVAHNAVIEDHAHEAVQHALTDWLGHRLG
ncbi:DUF4336 domain-containing protein [Paraburkholderia ferrariae]|uniref:DUF4336 domain-containing protein n=1 Tax=Paraburkholderia ferrariae TaxID=386056 RepID=UPI00048714BB|nr:DUF4336 domain-containing protein [Paraburkholderia ferrariae]